MHGNHLVSHKGSKFSCRKKTALAVLSGTTEADDAVVDSRARTKQDRGGGDGGGDELNLDPPCNGEH
jgi:hypothetical protein